MIRRPDGAPRRRCDDQEPLPWPVGAKCAATITFDIDTDGILHFEYREKADTLMASLSWLKYDEAAIPRILDMYRRCGIKQTFIYPAWCMERYPYLVEMILKGSHEITAYGYIHEDPNKPPRNEENYWLKRQIDVIEKMTWSAPARLAPTALQCLEVLGRPLVRGGAHLRRHANGRRCALRVADGTGGRHRTSISLGDGRLAAHTHSFDFNDMMTITSPDQTMNVFMSEFEAMYDFSGLWVTVWHPFVSRCLARCRRVLQMTEYMQSKGGV